MSSSFQIAILLAARFTSTGLIVVFLSANSPDCLTAQISQELKAKSKTAMAEIEAPSDVELVDAVSRSIDVFKNQIRPAQQRYNREQDERWKRIQDHRKMASRLKKANDQTLAKLNEERDQLLARIEFLARLEATITDKDPDAIQNAIADANSKITKLEKESRLAQRPYQDELSSIYKTYAAYNPDFAKHFEPFLREQGRGSFQAVKRTRVTANYAYAEAGARYESDELALTVIIRFADADQPRIGDASKRELLGNKFPILQSTSRGMSILIGSIKVNIYSIQSDLEPAIFKELLPSLIELDLLSEKLGRINR